VSSNPQEGIHARRQCGVAPAAAGEQADRRHDAGSHRGSRVRRHRETERAFSAAPSDSAYDGAAVAALNRAHDALVDWLTTSPTTMAGVLATLDYAASPLGGEPGDRTVLSDVWDSVERLERPARQFPALVAAALRKLVTHRFRAIRGISSA
jgi:hypothetical protein